MLKIYATGQTKRVLRRIFAIWFPLNFSASCNPFAELAGESRIVLLRPLIRLEMEQRISVPQFQRMAKMVGGICPFEPKISVFDFQTDQRHLQINGRTQ